MPEVVLDGLWAQVQPGGCLAGGRPFRQGQRDLQLLRSQLLAETIVADPRGLAARLQLAHRPVRPRRGTELVEGFQRCAQLLASLDALAHTAQPLAEVQLSARTLESVRRRLVMPERRLKARDEISFWSQQRLGTGSARQCEWLALGRSRGRIPPGHLARLRHASEASQRVDDVRRRG